MPTSPITASAYWRLYVPKLITVLREGYSRKNFIGDVSAGLTVAIVALPLSMALAIASGTSPERGIYTAIVAGFLISALGGSRFQIGGPAGAFVVIVHNAIDSFGLDGLAVATLMAGGMLVAAGLLRLGNWIKFVPHPVITGFTVGIAAIIFESQLGDFLGLTLTGNPSSFLDRLTAYAAAIETIDPTTLALGLASLALIVFLRRFRPHWPGFLIAVAAGAAAVTLLKLDIATVGTRFGAISTSLPAFQIPAGITLDRLRELLPTAFTIAFLAGIESLLSATVADSMTGRRHRANCELVAQGVANAASVMFGGITATGTIARTATNVRAGAYSPIAGMMHATFLLLFVVTLGWLTAYVPIVSLAAVLIVVSVNMAERKHVRQMIYAPPGDRIVFLLTLALTVFADLAVAIQFGVTLAALLYVHRITSAVEIATQTKMFEEEVDDLAVTGKPEYQADKPRNGECEVIRIRGPFFFGSTSRLGDLLSNLRRMPKVIILAMEEVPLIDSSGIDELVRFVETATARGSKVVIAGVTETVRHAIAAAKAGGVEIAIPFAKDVEDAKRMTLAPIKP